MEVMAFQYVKRDLSRSSFVWEKVFYNLYDSSLRSTFKGDMYFCFILGMLGWFEKLWIIYYVLLVVLLDKCGHLRRSRDSATNVNKEWMF